LKKDKTYKKNNSIIAYFLIIIFGATFIFSGTQIIKYIKNSKANERIADELSKYVTINNSEDNEKFSIDFKSLKEKNPDTIGYLKVNGTDIESVIVKTNNNSYYLSHNFEKKYNKSGWIFADYRNRLDDTDKNIIIYGHNMRNTKMFGTLKNVLTANWQENEQNRYIILATEKGTYIYDVFSVYQIEVEDYYITTDFEDNISFQSFANKLKSRSEKEFKADITNTSQILTLSTCGNSNKYRIVVHAIKLE